MFNEFVFFTGMSNLANECFWQSSIEEITLPTSLRTISGSYQFLNCKQLKKIVVLEGLTSVTSIQWIWGSAPSGILIILPSTVSNLRSDALATYGNNNSTVIVCKAVTPPTKTNTSYYQNVGVVYVPDESVDAYKTAAGWSQWASKIKPLSEYEEV